MSIAAAPSLKAAALAALRSGRAAEARDFLREALRDTPDDIALWLNLAGAERASGDFAQAFEALEGALRLDPRCFQALLMKAALVERTGDLVQAAIGYGLALGQAPDPDLLDPPTRRAFEHAREVHADYSARLRQCMLDAVSGEAALGRSEEGRRIGAFIDFAVGKRKIYPQKPTSFYYPGLPTLDFYPRELFPWIGALEAETPAIARELAAILADGSEHGFAPYVDYPDSLPLDQWAELNHSPRWNAFHLERNGAPVLENAARAPNTLAAIARAPRPHVAGRTPASMLSTLKPKTRIPPHTGVSNTRLVVHLALVVPPDCGFRVGAETRAWCPGEAFVFADTVEHEAWHKSDQPRPVLIFDIWSPFLSESEREMIRRVTAALDEANGFTPGGEL